ncbi:MAG: hypothetical protein WC730_00950 [Patescibacteria group bacterium]|jgi:hypothetical protein
MKKVLPFILSTGLIAFPCIAQAVALTNPLGITDPRLIAARIIQGALSVLGTVALVMFMYGGLLWIISMGKPEQIKQGQSILIWTTLGLILIAGAYVAVDAIFNAVLSGNVAG